MRIIRPVTTRKNTAYIISCIRAINFSIKYLSTQVAVYLFFATRNMNMAKEAILNNSVTITSIEPLLRSMIELNLNSAGPLHVDIYGMNFKRTRGMIEEGKPMRARKMGPAKAPTMAISVSPIMAIDISATTSTILANFTLTSH